MLSDHHQAHETGSARSEFHADGSLTIHQACPAPIDNLTTTRGPDGRWYAVARSRDETVCWPVDAPHERSAQVSLPRLLQPEPEQPVMPLPLWKSAVAPVQCADGETVVCKLTAEGVVRRVNLRTDEELGEPLDTGWRPTVNNARGRPLPCSGQIACFSSAGISADNSEDNSADDDSAIVAACPGPHPTYDVVVWDVASGERLGTIHRADLGIHSLSCMAGARSADGTPVLLIADRLGHVHSYNARTLQPTAPPFTPLGARVQEAVTARLSDGSTVLAVEGEFVHFYDIRTGKPIGNPRQPSFNSLGRHAVANLPDGRSLLATATDDGIHRLDLATATECARHEDEHTTTIWDLTTAQLPDGTVILAGAGHDFRVHRWHAETGQAYGEPLRGHPICVKAITVDPHPEDGRPVLISGCEFGYVFRWDAATGEQIGEPTRITSAHITGMHVVELPDQRRLLICTDSAGLLHRHDLRTGHALSSPIPVGGQIPTPDLPLPLPPATLGTFTVDGRILEISSPRRGAVTIRPR
jgi:WD40 repeat protein